MQLKSMKTIGLLGGTFDPIHNGHLRIALELYQQLQLNEVRFIPCQQPVIDKSAQANAEHRLQMLQLALNQQPGFIIDNRELQRSSPSYTIDTLISLRAELENTTLCFIIGSDSLTNLPRWHRWQELINYAHLIIIPRPNYNLPNTGVLTEFIKQHQTTDPTLLKEKPTGLLYIAPFTPLTISSTYIRQQIQTNLSPRYLLPDPVLQYIQINNVY